MDQQPKRSSKVPLMLMGAVAGAVALPALFSGTDVQRNRYASLQDCVADYTQTQCAVGAPVGSAGGSSGAYYYGPWYRSDVGARQRDSADPGPGRYYGGGGVSSLSSSHGAPAGVETGTRGGFGSTGRVGARGS